MASTETPKVKENSETETYQNAYTQAKRLLAMADQQSPKSKDAKAVTEADWLQECRKSFPLDYLEKVLDKKESERVKTADQLGKLSNAYPQYGAYDGQDSTISDAYLNELGYYPLDAKTITFSQLGNPGDNSPVGEAAQYYGLLSAVIEKQVLVLWAKERMAYINQRVKADAKVAADKDKASDEKNSEEILKKL